MAANKLGQWMDHKHHRGATPPPASQSIRQDRKAAQDLKFSLQPRAFTALQPTPLPPNKTSPWLQSQPSYRPLDGQLIHDFAGHGNIAHTQRTFDDVTIVSDLEHTRSDVAVGDHVPRGRAPHIEEEDMDGLVDNEAYKNGYGQDFDVDFEDSEQHALCDQQQYLSAGQQLGGEPGFDNDEENSVYVVGVGTTPRKSQGISGRFQASSSQNPSVIQKSALQHRPSQTQNPEHHQPVTTKKRARRENKTFLNQQYIPGQEPYERAHTPGHVAFGNGGLVALDGQQANFGDSESEDPEEDSTNESLRNQVGSRETPGTQPKLERAEEDKEHFSLDCALDYDDEKLNKMSFSELKNASWESQPDPPQPNSSEAPQPVSSDEKDISKMTLDEKLQYLALKGDGLEQVDFFASLPYKEWEEAGDIFLMKFGELLAKFKDARKAKRDLVAEFEKEIEEREQEVEGKSQHLGMKLKDMRASGDAVLKGKLGLT